MDTVQDIVMHTMDKNTDALKAAVDNVMSVKAADHIEAMRTDYAASVLSGTYGQSHEPQADLASTEGTTDENV